jgi:hypothetical protein
MKVLKNLPSQAKLMNKNIVKNYAFMRGACMCFGLFLVLALYVIN